MGRTFKVVAGIAVVALGAVVFMQWASASPPPPHFSDFTITNYANVPVENISVEFHHATAASSYSQLDPEPTIVTISKLAPGRQLVISGGATGTQAMYGVAKIVVRAQCPGGQDLQTPAEIHAEKRQFDPATESEEFSGFCVTAPAGQANYAPRLEFRLRAGGGFEARLSGRSRWIDQWSPIISDTKPFGP